MNDYWLIGSGDGMVWWYGDGDDDDGGDGKIQVLPEEDC